jgi:hypothetical protein
VLLSFWRVNVIGFTTSSFINAVSEKEVPNNAFDIITDYFPLGPHI